MLTDKNLAIFKYAVLEKLAVNFWSREKILHRVAYKVTMKPGHDETKRLRFTL